MKIPTHSHTVYRRTVGAYRRDERDAEALVWRVKAMREQGTTDPTGGYRQ
jgi:hypothetical protein